MINLKQFLFCIVITYIVSISLNFFLINNKKEIIQQNIAIPGSSGQLFSGEKTRTYNEKRSNFKKKNIKKKKSNICKNWGVVTTIFDLSDSVIKVGSLIDWCLVIVLDRNGKNRTEYEKLLNNRVTILDVTDQEKMSIDFIKKLPWNHFSRKNVGYYYAISQGAEIIFDFDDDNLLYNDNFFYTLLNSYSLEVVNVKTKEHSFNPYPLMNPTTKITWPRGFPLDKIKESNNYKEIENITIENNKIGIIQSLANNDPDVDAIYRLTSEIPLNFKTNNRIIITPKNSLTPFNAQATIWKKNTFWGLLLPITVHGRVSDIWRSYIVGRILMECDTRIVFTAPFVIQNRNPHNYLKDFQAESPLYFKSSAMVAFLQNWKPKGKGVFNLLEEIIIELYEREFIEIEDVELYKLWIESLIEFDIDLQEPLFWKNLDWKTTDPPDYECNQNKNLKFYDFNLHDGVMMDHSNLIEHSLSVASKTKHEVFHWNYKKSQPATNRGLYPLKNSPIQTLPLSKFADDKHSEKIWKLFHNNEHFSDVDALIFGFLPGDFQYFLQFNKSVIIDAAHRINLFRCTINESLNTFQTIRNMEKSISPKHIIGAHYLYDVEYIKFYTGVTPIFLPATQLDSIGISYIGSKNMIFINGHVRPIELINMLNGNFEIIHSDDYKKYNYKSITEMKAVIYLPYSISNYKFIDHYAMNIPILSPTPRFAVELKLYNDRTVAGNKYYCPNLSENITNDLPNPQSEKDELFWIKFAEVYNLPCITLFDSWEDLSEKLYEIDVDNISKCMKQSNKWRKYEALQNWCFVTKQILGSNSIIPKNRPKIIDDSEFLVQ